MSEGDYPRLNLALKAEIEHICMLTDAVKWGKPDDRELARQIDRWGRSQGLVPAGASYMSEEGFTGIMRKGSEPEVDTLRKAARFARTKDPTYSIGRLFRAAAWYDADDPDVDPHRVGPALTPTQARLCSLVPQLEDDEAGALAHSADVYIRIRARARGGP